MSYYDDEGLTTSILLDKRWSSMANARQEGFEVIEGEPNLILLDIDRPYGLALTSLKYKLSRARNHPRGFRLVLKEHWPSKSGNLHAVILVEPMRGGAKLSGEERSLLAVRLGSDPIRERLHRLVWPEIEEPALLFKPGLHR